MQLRDYQREAVDSIYSYFNEHDGNPLIVMPTGSGKSFVMAAFIREVIERWSDQRILVLTHVKELIQQNYVELVDHWTMAPAGIYSAGLNRRDANKQIIFAGIQSVHKRANDLQGFDLILVDEAHLVPRNSDTMYRRFLDDMKVMNENVKIIGFTATHYRLDSGVLTDGKDRIFTDIAYEVSVKLLIEQGYLCSLVTKDPTHKLDTSGVKTRGGEFVAGDLAKAVDKVTINEVVCREIRVRGSERKSWLIFCAGVDHAIHIRDILRKQDIIAATITGDTNKMEREFILEDFKAGRIRAVTNCDVLTTGFNAPMVDLLAMLRPTKSTGLYVQMLGRGMRTALGKDNCLVLDFAGNIQRHGPVDDVRPQGSWKEKGEPGTAPMKTCPKCQSVIYAGLIHCPGCNYEFPRNPPDMEPEASKLPVMKEVSEPFWIEVETVVLARHYKKDKPDSLRVDYRYGFQNMVSEWICLEHDGFAGRKAADWWRRMGGDLKVRTVTDALAAGKTLHLPTHVLCAEDGRFTRVVQHYIDPEGRAPVLDVWDELTPVQSKTSEATELVEVDRFADEEDGLPF